MIVSADEERKQFEVRVDADGGQKVTIKAPFKGNNNIIIIFLMYLIIFNS